MLLAGDEIGRTQRGNNNAYCQDNELTWIDWDLDEPRRELLAFTRKVLRDPRTRIRCLRRRRFFRGRAELTGTGFKDLAWLRPDGQR